MVLWASAFVRIRAAGEDLSPGPLSLARLLVGGIAPGALVVVRRDALPPRSDAVALLVCGLLWFGVNNLAFNAAERRVPAGTGPRRRSAVPGRGLRRPARAAALSRGQERTASMRVAAASQRASVGTRANRV